MFKIDAIVLKKNYIKENNIIITLFSKDFGKINVWFKESKLKSPIDIWNIINCLVKTKNNINICDSYKIKICIDYSNLNFKSIQNILDLLNYIYQLIPENLPLEDIFNDYKYCTSFLEKNDLNTKIIELLKLKLIKKTWISLDHNKKSDNLKRLNNVISKFNFDKILNIQGINLDLIQEIYNYNKESFRQFILS